jgi:hypothetical protein
MRRIVIAAAFALAVAAAYAQDAPRWVTRRTAVYPPEQYVNGAGRGGGGVNVYPVN